MRNKLTLALSVLVVLLAGASVYLYWGLAKPLALEVQELEAKIRAQSAEHARLHEHIEYLNRQLEENVARIAREKDAEIARQSGAHDEMIAALRKEIDLGQIRIKRLADRLTVTIVDKILFPSGEDQIGPDGGEVLKRLGHVIAQTQGRIVRIEGHTDNIPVGLALRTRFATNWELSAARAINVARTLQAASGLKADTIEAVALGEHHPVASNDTPEGRAQNRRIEIILHPRIAPPGPSSGSPPAPTDRPRG